MLEADVGVVGLGAMGSSALWHLASRGVNAIGFDRFEPGHDRGSSHGDTRIIRTAYAEGAEYVPLLNKAFRNWRTLERETGVELLRETGGLMIGRPDSALIQGVRSSIETHDLEHESLDAADLRRLYPQHVVDDDDVAIRERQAGYLRPEAAVRAATARARSLGASIMSSTEVKAVDFAGDSIVADTTAGRFMFRHLVMAAGAWTSSLLPDAELPLTVERQVQLWFAVDDPSRYGPDRFPVFIRDLPKEGLRFYGFPHTDGRTIKVAGHHGGRETLPDELDREILDEDSAQMREVMATHFTGVSSAAVEGRACMYTNTPDEHFMIGDVAGLPGITLVSACSGHGFKFASVIGEIAADLATEGETNHDISLFRTDRFTALPQVAAGG